MCYWDFVDSYQTPHASLGIHKNILGCYKLFSSGARKQLLQKSSDKPTTALLIAYAYVLGRNYGTNMY